MPDKNVQLPDGRVVAFPDSMADADIAAVIKKQLSASAGFAGGTLPAPSKIPPEMTGHPEEGLQKEDIPKHLKAAAEVLGSTVGADAVPVVRGLAGLLLRSLGAGAGAGAANVGAQAITTGQVNPEEALRTAGGFAGGEAIVGGAQALGETRAALRDLFFKPNAQLTDLGKAIVHPTDLPEMLVRRSLGVEAPAARAESVPISKSPNYDPAAYRAGAAMRSSLGGPKIEVSNNPFEGMTSSEKPIGTAELPKTAPSKPPIQLVKEFAAPEPSKIVTPESGPVPINRTLVSYPRNALVQMARAGHLDALRELLRNPGGIDVMEAVPNAKFLIEPNAPTNVYGGPK